MAVTGVEIFRFVGGKAVEHWDFYDELGMMRQLGLVPTRE
jgi:predicted SnoaL-like aldol condensation-catalyzing enzyme